MKWRNSVSDCHQQQHDSTSTYAHKKSVPNLSINNVNKINPFAFASIRNEVLSEYLMQMLLLSM